MVIMKVTCGSLSTTLNDCALEYYFVSLHLDSPDVIDCRQCGESVSQILGVSLVPCECEEGYDTVTGLPPPSLVMDPTGGQLRG